MQTKTIKFRDNLAKLILSGEKTLTWRIFDDKDLKKDDVVDLINWNTGKPFAKAELIDVWEKKMKELEESDFDGHEKFASDEEMYATYRTFYGDTVGPDTIVKIIRFKLLV
jgi:hypothetical protein